MLPAFRRKSRTSRVCVRWGRCVYVGHESIYILRMFKRQTNAQMPKQTKKRGSRARFSYANLFRPKRLHSYPIRIFNRIAFNWLIDVLIGEKPLPAGRAIFLFFSLSCLIFVSIFFLLSQLFVLLRIRFRFSNDFVFFWVPLLPFSFSLDG